MCLYVGDDELLEDEDKCLKDIYGLEELNNELLKGVRLAAEINSSNSNLKCFISIFAYQYDKCGEYVEMTKFLKKVYEEKKQCFLLREGMKYQKNI